MIFTKGMNILIGLIEAKPSIGFFGTVGGSLAGLLTWIGVITPVLGCIAACLGVVAGIITVMIKLREWRNGKRN